jgi:chromosomal replication initiator protein
MSLSHEPEKHAASRQPVWTPRQVRLAVVEAVARDFGLTINDIMGRSRNRYIVTARMVAVCMVHIAWPEMSYPDLGRLFCRDHTTILHYIGETIGTRLKNPTRRRVRLDVL